MNELPVFLENPSTKRILAEVKDLIPEGTKVYLFGGAVRNAIYHDHFGEEMTQRDYDCIIVGDGEKFAENLTNTGFTFGSKNSAQSKILKKNRIPEPIHIYDDWVYLDCKIHGSDENIVSILEKTSDFTISGVALDINDIFSLDWRDHIFAIPHAIEDIQNKQIRLVTAYSASIYKIIRLVSRDFKKPSQEEIGVIYKKLSEISEKKFTANVEKTVRYVGSEEKVIEIAKDLGITKNILNFNEIKAAS